jgi:hypothetical protein
MFSHMSFTKENGCVLRPTIACAAPRRMALDLLQDIAVVLRIARFQQLLHHEVPKLVIRQLHLWAPIGTPWENPGERFSGGIARKGLVYEQGEAPM